MTPAACTYDEYYYPSSRGDEHIRISPVFQNTNSTPYNATSTFTSTSTGTVALTVTASATVNANVIVEGVSGTFSVAAYVSLTISYANTISVNTPPYSTVYAAYGVWRSTTPGTYYKYAMTTGCSSTSFSAYAHTPKSIGWHIWT